VAAGIITAGFGGGTALFIPFIAWIIQHRGYATAFLWTGILQGVVILIVAQFLRHPAMPVPATAVTPAAGASAMLGQHQFTTGEMIRTPQFYALYAAFVMMATGGLLVTANAGPIAQSWEFPAARWRWRPRSMRWPTARAGSRGDGCRTRSAANSRWAWRSR